MNNASKTKSETPDVRSQILAVATELFAADGFDGTPLQAISDRVGVAKPSLLYHFSSKDELRRGVLDQVMSHWNEVLPRLLQAATSGENRFEALISESIAFFTEDSDRARLLVREMLDRPEQTKNLFEQYLGPWMKILADYIRRGQDEEIIHSDVDPEAYILEIIQLVVGTVALGDVVDRLLGAAGEDDAPHARQLAEVIRVARSGLFIDARNP
jgi:AcrR family transcriptional regulator